MANLVLKQAVFVVGAALATFVIVWILPLDRLIYIINFKVASRYWSYQAIFYVVNFGFIFWAWRRGRLELRKRESAFWLMSASGTLAAIAAFYLTEVAHSRTIGNIVALLGMGSKGIIAIAVFPVCVAVIYAMVVAGVVLMIDYFVERYQSRPRVEDL